MNETLLPAQAGFRMPAEWAPHEATWLAWPHNETDWPGRFEVIPPVFVELVRALTRFERVRLLVEDAGERDRVLGLLAAAGVDRGRVTPYVAPTNRSWTRDYLPSFVTRPGEVAAVKWRFNGWARYDDHDLDEEAGARVARWLGVREWRARALRDGREERVVLEGGGIDVDGEGTVLVTEECLLSGPNARDPWLDRSGMERILGDYIGASNAIWLTVGIEGDDTSGHVDDFARFVGPGRVVLCEERNSSDENYAVLQENRERLQGARDALGRKLEVIPLPMPAPLVYEGQRLPASYANFYFANGAVLVPTFDDPMDEEALGILREVMPGREVVPVRCTDLVLGLGSIHCSTQQEPAKPPAAG